METNEKITENSSPECCIDSNFWSRELVGERKGVCFCTAFELDDLSDLTSLAKSMPDGVVICDSSMVAGIEHLEQVLVQANELWGRGGEIARKKSIDLLMRITGQSQISEAIALSRLERTNSFVTFGIVASRDHIEESLELIKTRFPRSRRNDSLLDLDRKKENLLRKAHNLPSKLSKSQLVVALKEKSALLVFSN
jgi:tRNA threonylcarbamoyladenosine modification (KEOPS) complex Cgi121 subunit